MRRVMVSVRLRKNAAAHLDASYLTTLGRIRLLLHIDVPSNEPAREIAIGTALTHGARIFSATHEDVCSLR